MFRCYNSCSFLRFHHSEFPAKYTNTKSSDILCKINLYIVVSSSIKNESVYVNAFTSEKNTQKEGGKFVAIFHPYFSTIFISMKSFFDYFIIPEFFTAFTASFISSTVMVSAKRTCPLPSSPKLLPGVHNTPDFSRSSITNATSSV